MNRHTHMSPHLIKPHNILTFHLKPPGRAEPGAVNRVWRHINISHFLIQYKVQSVYCFSLSPPPLRDVSPCNVPLQTQWVQHPHVLTKQWDSIVSSPSSPTMQQTINYEQMQGFDVVLNSWIWYVEGRVGKFVILCVVWMNGFSLASSENLASPHTDRGGPCQIRMGL